MNSESQTSQTPLCKCHREPMRWRKDPRRKAGGYWYCIEKKREAERRYDQTDNGLQRHHRYNASDKGRARYDRYYDDPTPITVTSRFTGNQSRSTVGDQRYSCKRISDILSYHRRRAASAEQRRRELKSRVHARLHAELQAIYAQGGDQS